MTSVAAHYSTDKRPPKKIKYTSAKSRIDIKMSLWTDTDFVKSVDSYEMYLMNAILPRLQTLWNFCKRLLFYWRIRKEHVTKYRKMKNKQPLFTFFFYLYLSLKTATLIIFNFSETKMFLQKFLTSRKKLEKQFNDNLNFFS